MPSSRHDQPPKTAATRKTGRAPEVEHLSAEAEIREREQTLETLLRNLPDAVVRVDRDGRHIVANPACEGVLGVPSTELIGKTIQELPVPPRLRKIWLGRVKKVLESGKTLDVEDTLETPGGLHYHETRLVPERDELGDVVTVLIVIHDVSERRRVARSLGESEERFRVTFEEAPIAMLVTDKDAHIRTGNAAARALLGYSQEEFAEKSIYEITHPDDLELTRDVSERISEKNEPTAVIEKRYIRKNGEIVWGHISVSAVRDAEQRLVQYIAQIVDITSLKQAERALRESIEQQRLVTEYATDLIAVVSLDFTIRLISQSVRDGLGYEPEELIGHNIAELIDPEMIDEIRVNTREILDGKPPWNRSFRLRHRNGDWRMFEGVGSIARDEDGQPAYIVAILRDVTERSLLERQLLIAQKMEAVGQLAGGVAHDFNNLLTVINGFADMAIKTLGNRDEGIRHYLAEIGHAGRRAAELTQHLLAFSRQQVLQPEVVDINSIIEEYVGMLRRILGEEIELLTRLESELRTVEVDPGQLGQVLMNLVVNARDAMPQGGTVTIATQNIGLKKAIPIAQGALPRGSYVLLSVADNGEGMPPEIREHVFEPFFTTKAPGQGTGLGLSTVVGIVEQSGGAVAVDSEPGAGTTFRVYLPRSKAAVTKKTLRVEKLQTGAGTILVAEDDDAVRKLVAKMLLEAGYRVLVSALPSEAISLAKWEPSIDVLVTDVVMPEMNGHELAQRLLALRPDLRVLYISGYTPDVVRAKGVLTQQESFLQKPFTAAVLTQAVRDLTARTATRTLPS
jgi:PAS domain S-box-containing protein